MEWRIHVHLVGNDSQELMDLIGFRDYLRKHSEVAAEYACIKERAATDAASDGAKYIALKESFILEKITEARRLYGGTQVSET